MKWKEHESCDMWTLIGPKGPVGIVVSYTFAYNHPEAFRAMERDSRMMDKGYAEIMQAEAGPATEEMIVRVWERECCGK